MANVPQDTGVESHSRVSNEIELTQAMVDAGVEALLASFSEDRLAWYTPGLEPAVSDIFRAMLEARENRVRKFVDSPDGHRPELG